MLDSLFFDTPFVQACDHRRAKKSRQILLFQPRQAYPLIEHSLRSKLSSQKVNPRPPPPPIDRYLVDPLDSSNLHNSWPRFVFRGNKSCLAARASGSHENGRGRVTQPRENSLLLANASSSFFVRPCRRPRDANGRFCTRVTRVSRAAHERA